ncbi:MAG: response regulator transcription factor [Chitinophagaceae bacterium]
MISVLIVDDHKLLRDSLMLMLKGDNRFIIAGQASCGEQAIELARSVKPDVILMDVNMGPLDGIAATKAIHTTQPGIRIIALTAHSEPAYAKTLMTAGASGFITKNSTQEELTNAITTVVAGKTYVCMEIKNNLASTALIGNFTACIEQLTRTEIKVARLVKNGLSSREIATQLGIARKTIEVHRYRMLKKLQFKNGAALVNWLSTQPV